MAQSLTAAADEWRAAKKAVEDAKQEVKAQQDRVRAAQAHLNESLVASAKQGVRMKDLVAMTGLTREWIRRVLRQNGIFPDD